MAALATSFAMVQVSATPARADLPDAYTQIVNHQVPVQPDGAPRISGTDGAATTPDPTVSKSDSQTAAPLPLSNSYSPPTAWRPEYQSPAE
jgi:hypothetical protein